MGLSPDVITYTNLVQHLERRGLKPFGGVSALKVAAQIRASGCTTWRTTQLSPTW